MDPVEASPVKARRLGSPHSDFLLDGVLPSVPFLAAPYNEGTVFPTAAVGASEFGPGSEHKGDPNWLHPRWHSQANIPQNPRALQQ